MCNKKEFVTVVDTVAIKTDITNFSDFTKVNSDRYDYIDRVGDNFDTSQMKVKINLHTRFGEMTLNKLQAHDKALLDTLKTIGVVDMEQVKLDRIDIALDTSGYDFNTDFKKLLFAYELLTVKRKKASRWYTTNLNTFKSNTIKLYDKRLEIEFYNKREESKGTHPYNTRIEFRYKLIGKNLSSSIDYVAKCIDAIEEMDKHLGTLEIITSNKLISLWEQERDKLKSFSEFVRKYDNYFYTINILKVVYRSTGMKGAYKGWLDNFRLRNTLEFYTKADIKELQRSMKKSLKQYIK